MNLFKNVKIVLKSDGIEFQIRREKLESKY